MPAELLARVGRLVGQAIAALAKVNSAMERAQIAVSERRARQAVAQTKHKGPRSNFELPGTPNQRPVQWPLSGGCSAGWGAVAPDATPALAAGTETGPWRRRAPPFRRPGQAGAGGLAFSPPARPVPGTTQLDGVSRLWP
jgi:hypothetical protein